MRASSEVKAIEWHLGKMQSFYNVDRESDTYKRIKKHLESGNANAVIRLFSKAAMTENAAKEQAELAAIVYTIYTGNTWNSVLDTASDIAFDIMHRYYHFRDKAYPMTSAQIRRMVTDIAEVIHYYVHTFPVIEAEREAKAAKAAKA